MRFVVVITVLNRAQIVSEKFKVAKIFNDSFYNKASYRVNIGTKIA